jgi:tetratricopeptide (TPR) repeat protein
VIAGPVTIEIEAFRNAIAERLGLYFEESRLDFLSEILRQRMSKTGCGSYGQYEKQLASYADGREWVELAERLTVNETYFFRYTDHFRAFAEIVIPRRMEARHVERGLRILCAGCASGEEPYSVAILLREPEKQKSPVSARGREWNRAQALELLREERFGEGIEILQEMQEEAAGNADAQLLLAVLLTNRGELTAAETACRRVLEIDEMHAGAHYLIALCREHAGDLAGAVEHGRTAAYLDANFAMPRLHLGRLARRSNDLDAARRELGKALQLLEREEASRILLFGGGFTREALAQMCLGELKGCGGEQ